MQQYPSLPYHDVGVIFFFDIVFAGNIDDRMEIARWLWENIDASAKHKTTINSEKNNCRRSPEFLPLPEVDDNCYS